MASKQVAARAKSSTFVVAAANTHADAIQTGAKELLGPHLKKGEKLPDFAFLSQLLARTLEERTTALTAADDAHELEMADDIAPRETRDSATQVLYSKVVEIGEIVVGLFGGGARERLGLEGTTPRDPALLVRHVAAVSKALRSVDLGKPRLKGASFSGKAAADELEALLGDVQAALDDVAREAREAEATLVKKRAAMSSFDTAFSGTATLLSALLNVAGNKELASRVRPSSRRPGQAEGAEEDTSEEPKPAPTS